MSIFNTMISAQGYDVDPARIPEGNLFAMLSRGVKHYLGNESASKVTAWAAKYESERRAEAKKEGREISDQEAKPSEEQLIAKKAEIVREHLETLYKGEVGVTNRGPALDPVDSIVQRLAREDARTMLEAMKFKVPRGDKLKEATFKFPDGERTFDQLVEARVTKYSDTKDKFGRGDYRKRAEKELAAKASAKDKAAKQGEEMRQDSADLF